MKRFFNNVAMSKLDEYLGRDPSDVWTLCHGDFWSNNILFSYHPEKAADDAGGKVR